MEKERNRDKCEVPVHAGGTRGLAPLVLQVGTIRRRLAALRSDRCNSQGRALCVYRIGGKVASRLVLDTLKSVEFSCPCWESNYDSSVVHPIAQTLYSLQDGGGSESKQSEETTLNLVKDLYRVQDLVALLATRT